VKNLKIAKIVKNLKIAKKLPKIMAGPAYFSGPSIFP